MRTKIEPKKNVSEDLKNVSEELKNVDDSIELLNEDELDSVQGGITPIIKP